MEPITITTDFLFSMIGGAMAFVTAIALALVAWIGKQAINDLRTLEDEFEELEKNLPIDYIRYDVYIRDIDKLTKLIEKVLLKLDDKADK